MSRMFLAGILAILLALLGVMANVVGPKSKETEKGLPPQPPAQQNARDKKLKDDQSKLKSAMSSKSMPIDPGNAAEGKALAAKMGSNTSSKPGGATKNPNLKGMEITSDWFEKRLDGSAGIEKLDKEAQEEANARKAFAEQAMQTKLTPPRTAK